MGGLPHAGNCGSCRDNTAGWRLVSTDRDQRAEHVDSVFYDPERAVWSSSSSITSTANWSHTQR